MEEEHRTEPYPWAELIKNLRCLPVEVETSSASACEISKINTSVLAACSGK